MTSKEIVKRAILFQRHERISYDLPEKFGSDFIHVGCTPDPEWQPSIKTETKWEDEFGCFSEKVWKPKYKKVYEFAHSKGVFTFLHKSYIEPGSNKEKITLYETGYENYWY